MEKEKTERQEEFNENCAILISEMEALGISPIHLIEGEVPDTYCGYFNGTLDEKEGDAVRQALLHILSPENVWKFPSCDRVAVGASYYVHNGKGNELKPYVGTLGLSALCGNTGIQFQISQLKNFDNYLSWYVLKGARPSWERLPDKYSECYLTLFSLMKEIIEKRLKNPGSMVWKK